MFFSGDRTRWEDQLRSTKIRALTLTLLSKMASIISSCDQTRRISTYMEKTILTHRIFFEIQVIEHFTECSTDFHMNGRSSTLVAGSILMLLFVFVRIDTYYVPGGVITRISNILCLTGGPSEIRCTIFREQGVLIMDLQELAGRSNST